MSDIMTICQTAEGKIATKTHTFTNEGWETQDYDAGMYFRARQCRVRDMEHLFGLLHQLSKKPRCFVLRGQLRADVDGERPHRRIYKHQQPGPNNPNPPAPSYQRTDHRWLCLDVDDYVLPEDMRGEGVRNQAVRLVVDGLPDWLARAGYIAQWSSSAGLDGFAKAKMHLWFWLDRPACCRSLREHFKVWNDGSGATKVDVALFNPVQPHYTSAPIFSEGTVDPLLRISHAPSIAGGVSKGVVNDRLTWSPGDDAITPSDILGLDDYEAVDAKRRQEASAKQRLHKAAKRTIKGVWSEDKRSVRIANGAMRSAVSNAKAAMGTSNWYEVVRREIHSTYSHVLRGGLDYHVWRTTWEDVGATDGMIAVPGRKIPLGDIQRMATGSERTLVVTGSTFSIPKNVGRPKPSQAASSEDLNAYLKANPPRIIKGRKGGSHNDSEDNVND